MKAYGSARVAMIRKMQRQEPFNKPLPPIAIET
jgi:hypothetical protein